jgi:hypothetical protein
VRETELRARLAHHLGAAQSLLWADHHVVPELGNRTVREALIAGQPCKDIWRAVWATLALPLQER